MSPLAKKLLIKPGQRWLLLNPPEDYLAVLEPLPDDVQLQFEITQPVNGIQLFIKNSAELEQNLIDIKPVLKPETVLWFIYPKKNSGIDTDLEMMGSWKEAAQHGLSPVASAAVNNTWTALRFRPEHLVKRSDTSKDALRQQNDHSAYFDMHTKQVILPADVAESLHKIPEALAIFNSLAYSHRKEYIVWIVTAKQQQTRLARITQMTKKLLAGKKNPSVK